MEANWTINNLANLVSKSNSEKMANYFVGQCIEILSKWQFALQNDENCFKLALFKFSSITNSTAKYQ